MVGLVFEKKKYFGLCIFIKNIYKKDNYYSNVKHDIEFLLMYFHKINYL
jgi:hypothetical protein